MIVYRGKILDLLPHYIDDESYLLLKPAYL